MDLIGRITSEVLQGARLDDHAALALFQSSDLISLGQLADEVCRRRHGDRVWYNVNRHINPTNICSLSCKFCSYSRKPGDEGAYAYSTQEMVAKAGEAVAQGATEVHMVGGLHPRWSFDHYLEMIKAVKTAWPALHIKAFTAVELAWLARKARKTVVEVLTELQAVGLGSIPGGGAEIFHPEIREAICDTKLTAEQWLDIHRQAHRLGLRSNATMLYGHIESFTHRVDHMRRLRELQDETGGFNAFIPLAFQPYGNEMGIDHYTYGFDDLKTIAIARLYLDNFPHIKSYWIMLGQDIAQVALNYGANDLDGTVIEEKISRMAGGRSGTQMTRARIEQVIRRAGRQPVERDTLYHPVASVSARAQAQPEAAEAVQDVRPLVNRLTFSDEHGALELPDLLALARHASLHDLARLAQARPGRDPDSASFAPALVLRPRADEQPGELVRAAEAAIADSRRRHLLHPTVIAIDLSAGAGHSAGDGDGDALTDPGQLVELAWALHHSQPACDLTIIGLKGLWRMAQDSDVTMASLLGRLRDAGVQTVESSSTEQETDLTPGEVVELHADIHAAGLASVAKLELMAPKMGFGAPLWEDLCHRALALNTLRSGRHGLASVAVEVCQGSVVTAVDYLRAVALVRLALTGEPAVTARYDSIPTMAPGAASAEAAALPQHPAEKIAPLTLLHGASDFGLVDVRTHDPVAILRQIQAAGLRPAIRDAGMAAANLNSQIVQQCASVRHQPTVPQAALT